MGGSSGSFNCRPARPSPCFCRLRRAPCALLLALALREQAKRDPPLVSRAGLIDRTAGDDGGAQSLSVLDEQPPWHV